MCTLRFLHSYKELPLRPIAVDVAHTLRLESRVCFLELVDKRQPWAVKCEGTAAALQDHHTAVLMTSGVFGS